MLGTIPPSHITCIVLPQHVGGKAGLVANSFVDPQSGQR